VDGEFVRTVYCLDKNLNKKEGIDIRQLKKIKSLKFKIKKIYIYVNMYLLIY